MQKVNVWPSNSQGITSINRHCIKNSGTNQKELKLDIFKKWKIFTLDRTSLNQCRPSEIFKQPPRSNLPL